MYKKKTLGQQERVSRFNPAIFTLSYIDEQHGQTCYTVAGKHN